MKKFYLIVIPPRTIATTLISILLIIALLLSLSTLSVNTGSNRFVITSSSNRLDPEEDETSDGEAFLAIIIDDFGSGRDGVKELMSIDRHMTFAVMPFCEYTQKDANAAHEKGYEVIVHLAMEPVRGKKSWLGPKPILSGMKVDNVHSIVQDAFDNVPYAVGANIHMGSKASSEESIVAAILDVIEDKKAYFVDSCTAAKPIAKRIANENDIPCLERDVFLDGQQPKSFVKKRLSEACKIAKKKGYAVAIGHVGIEGGKVTAEAIKEMLPEFDANNIKLVFVSELMQE